MDPAMHSRILVRAAELTAPGRQSVGIVSDDADLAATFRRSLRLNGTDSSVIAPGDAWGALATLRAAREVVMASRFSSFALLGSLLGSRRIYVPQECTPLDLQRYGLEPEMIF